MRRRDFVALLGGAPAWPLTPGGNVTGLTNFAEELASKQIDLMRELSL